MRTFLRLKKQQRRKLPAEFKHYEYGSQAAHLLPPTEVPDPTEERTIFPDALGATGGTAW